MNTIDLVVCLVLLLAVWSGWRSGFILQVCSLAGILAGILLAGRYGARVGAWLRLDESIAQIAGFVVVLIAVILLVALLGRALRGVSRFAGLGVLDYMLGVVVSLFKYLLLLGVVFAALDNLNDDYSLIKAETIHSSRTYEPIVGLSESIFPFLERAWEQVPWEEFNDQNREQTPEDTTDDENQTDAETI